MRVAVFGAGYAGLTVTRRLERRLPGTVEIVVVDESATHLLQHELHRAIRRPSLAETITVPLEEALDRAEIRQARVTDVDPDRGTATLDTDAGEETLEYDAAAVCLGSQTDFYGIPGLREHAIPLKRLDDAERIHDRALGEETTDVIVGGAGLSGIQAAGELAALSAEADLELDVTLVEMADHIAPGFDTTFAGALRRELEARDVRIETGATVAEAGTDTVHLEDGRTLPYDLLVWTGGIRGPDALAGERATPESDLAVGEATFVVGDAAEVVDESGTTAPASAQTAVRQARVAATNIQRVVNARRVDDEAPPEDGPRFATYKYDSPGWVVSVGDGAVATIGPLILSGDPARAAKAAIGASHLSSVGAIAAAAELVRNELGWPDADAVDFSPYVAALLDERALADTAAVGEDSLASLLAIAGELNPDGPIDLTELTRATDRAFPGSPANQFERLVVDPMLALGKSTLPTGKSDEDE
ncbi:NAD(P)/FAD-dependent oxidoreductase [Natronomonas amylolytica]|uniref:NAD(P)/FAD-dependent oxidoreductase n=1 Tax=Natronomonas amylolytica TaxID=3108498 RepID=UPI003008C23C